MNKGYRWDRILKRTKGEKSLDTAPLRVGKSRETLPLKLQSDKALLIITLVASLYRNMCRTVVLHTLSTEYNSTSPAVESTATRTGGITSSKSFNVPGLFFYPAGVYILHRKSVVFFSPMIWNSADMN